MVSEISRTHAQTVASCNAESKVTDLPEVVEYGDSARARVVSVSPTLREAYHVALTRCHKLGGAAAADRVSEEVVN